MMIKSIHESENAERRNSSRVVKAEEENFQQNRIFIDDIFTDVVQRLAIVFPAFIFFYYFSFLFRFTLKKGLQSRAREIVNEITEKKTK